ncbi:MAG: hypothetical protein R2826_02330 [Thermoleophilia bacterium]
MDSLRQALRALVAVVAFGLLCLPAALAFACHWVAIGEGTATRLESWTLLALAYLVWSPLVVVPFVWANDRLGYRWVPAERAPRLRRHRVRRLFAGLRLLEGISAGRPTEGRGAQRGGSESPHERDD